jgi:hypothetical protein
MPSLPCGSPHHARGGLSDQDFHIFDSAHSDGASRLYSAAASSSRWKKRERGERNNHPRHLPDLPGAVRDILESARMDEEPTEYQKGLPYLSWEKMNTPTFWWLGGAFCVYIIAMAFLLRYLDAKQLPSEAKKKKKKMKKTGPKISTQWSMRSRRKSETNSE